MNKIFNINLGGYPFTIDDNAFFTLDKYLTTIRNHFADSEGCDDIISDIESRIAELLNDEMKGQPIVGMREVEKIISIMGKPEEFGATTDHTEDEHTESTHKKSAHTGSKYKTGKRLFRDYDEKVIGGVCSGLAAYFGIHDPLWVRIAFVIGLFGGGIAVPLYLILWAAVPAAKTSSDKLAMKGEKIDVSSIAKKVEEELNNLTETISEFTREFNSKKKG